MDILSKMKEVADKAMEARARAQTVKKVESMVEAGGEIVNEVFAGIKNSRTESRLEILESYAFELIFEKSNAPYIDGAYIYDATKSIYLYISATENKGARCLRATDLNNSGTRFIIAESKGRYAWNGASRETDFYLATDRIKNDKLELKIGGPSRRCTLPRVGFTATETITGYKVTDAAKEVVAESVGKLRTDDRALIYIRDPEDFNLSLAMLFSPVFFPGVFTDDNFSKEYEKYVHKHKH